MSRRHSHTPRLVAVGVLALTGINKYDKGVRDTPAARC